MANESNRVHLAHWHETLRVVARLLRRRDHGAVALRHAGSPSAGGGVSLPSEIDEEVALDGLA